MAGEFQMWTKVTAGVGVSPRSGQRRFANYHISRAEKGGSACKNAGNESQHGIRSQWVNLCFLPAEQYPGADAVAAEEILIQVIYRKLLHNLSLSQVNEEDFPNVTASHDLPPEAKSGAQISE